MEETMPLRTTRTGLAALGREWIAAWNSRDLERVLALYAEDSRDDLGQDPGARLRRQRTRCAARTSLRAYWGKALTLLPESAFRR